MRSGDKQKDEDRDDDAAEYSPFYGIEKGAVLQEARIFNDSHVDARRCQQVCEVPRFELDALVRPPTPEALSDLDALAGHHQAAIPPMPRRDLHQSKAPFHASMATAFRGTAPVCG